LRKSNNFLTFKTIEMSTITLTDKESTYASGEMPHTDFQYEEFEGFLASYYLTYLHLNESTDGDATAKFKAMYDTLVRFAERHKVQVPQEAIKNVRAKEEWGKPSKLTSYFMVKDSFNAFRTDFGLLQNKEDQPDIQALWELIKDPLFVF
jgi:hypothetical protein